jgi:hypothetical protein
VLLLSFGFRHSTFERVWLPLAEGLFVLVTLGSLEAVKMSNVENQMSNQ